jgi:RHS repeat-associated protein
MASSEGSSSVISLPKGGGALHGIGEKFSPDLHTGTGNFTVPISLPAGRNGFQPQLNLVYSTGNGNGPFGLGWGLSIPGVIRKTWKKIPRYQDSSPNLDEQDTFILSGAEDLVPVTAPDISPTQYRPRTEGLFARIERHLDLSNDFWEVRSKDGLISRYGTSDKRGQDPAVVADPSDRTKVSAWKLTRTVDPFGNRIEYEYERDMGEDGPHHWDQLYLKRIRYADYGDTEFLVSVTFEYEEERPDSFSEYRSGFEIRTRKWCTRISIRTHTDAERLVRTYDFIYLDKRPELTTAQPLNGVSLLSQIKVTGHDGANQEPLPPLEFAYTQFQPEEHCKLSSLEGDSLPATSLGNPDLELVDLFGQGFPDFMEMTSMTCRYWRNRGNGQFDFPRNMTTAPAGVALSDAGVQLLDANGNGCLDLLVSTPIQKGYYPLRFGGLWDQLAFKTYPVAPGFNLQDPDIRLIDLDGDGVTDALRSAIKLECFFNDPVQGWNRTRSLDRKPLDEFPNVNFSDPRVKVADMSGDGLQDIVMVQNGVVEYWPNLGYGNWGKRVTMLNSPTFPFGHDPNHILVGDVDGDGLADIVYVDSNQITLWINRSGNSWSDPIIVQGMPLLSNQDSIRMADMLGTGISGVLWSKNLMQPGSSPFRFLDFTGGEKPYLLNEMNNHIGAVTKVKYVSSSHFFLEDQKNPAMQWQTILPFPVQVVSQVEVIDEISQGKKTTEYRYHHGYWEGIEREFRGFGMVEQFDSEFFDRYDDTGLHGPETFFAKIDKKYFSAPTLTKTWFHQGPVHDEFDFDDELDLSAEYWSGDPSMLTRSAATVTLLNGLDRQSRRDALRAMRGSILRTELYARDSSALEGRPYTVTESSYGLIEVAPPTAGENRKHIFFPHIIAQRTTQWERGNDPMTQLSYTKDYDEFGQPRQQTQIACPRGWRSMSDQLAETYLATRSQTSYAVPLDNNVYIRDRVAQSISYELTQSADKTVAELLQQSDAGTGLNLIGHTLHFYDGEPFGGLELGKVGQFGALVRTETLVMTDDIITSTYGADRPPYLIQSDVPVWPPDYPEEFKTNLSIRAGYLFRGGAPYTPGYYVATDRRHYDFHDAVDGKGLVRITRGPLGASQNTEITYDFPYKLLPVKVTDPLGLLITAEHDYRVLQPKLVTDVNGNFTEITFSPLGLVKTTSVKGKAGEGDQTQPSAVMEYNFQAFVESPPSNRQPIFVHTTRRVHHDTETDVPLPERDETIQSYEYSDGFGRLLQTRAQAEDVLFGDPVFGTGVIPDDQTIQPGDIVGRHRAGGDPVNVAVSGWQIYDNKGRVVEKYEPFFSSGWEYRSPQNEVDQLARHVLGKQVSMYYDPRGHVIRTVNPDQSEQRVVFGVPGAIAEPDLSDPADYDPTPWEAYTYDANDNAGRTHAGQTVKYAYHWNTPTSIVVDALGRTIEIVERNCSAPGDPVEEYRTSTTYDIRGNVLTIADALGREAFRHVHDLGNRQLSLDSIDAGVRKMMFDATGQVLEQRDGKGAWVLHRYDATQRPLRLWARDDENSDISLRVRTEYGDGSAPDQPDAERTANGLHNQLGKPYRQYDEAGLSIFETYDFKGNLLEKTRRVIEDEDILAVFAAPPLDWEITAFRVDWQPPAGVTQEAHATTLLEDTEYRTSTTFDALNRTKRLRYPEDVEGNRKELIPSYNRGGALEHMTLDGAIYVEQIAYNAKRQRTLIAYGNGIMTAQAHDANTFRLNRLWSGRYGKPDGTEFTYRPSMADQPLQDLAYGYDLVGNIWVIQDRTPGSGINGSISGIDQLDREFVYDALYRLKSATGRECDRPPDWPWDDSPRCSDLTKTRSYTEQYLYDVVGNIKQLKHLANGAGFTRDFEQLPGNNRLLTLTVGAATVFDYDYDANGNMTRETTSRHFEWDYADRMRVYRTQTDDSEPTVHAHYLYDAGGQRVKNLVRKQGGQVEVTVYIDGIFEYQRIVLAGNVEQNNTLHVMDNQSRIALVRVGNPFANDTTPAVKYHLGDHLGSSNMVIDDSGNWVNREEYTPYGETSFGNFAWKRYRFTGKERNEESGLYYFGFRYYATHLARWISCDPAGTVDGVSLYCYVSDNPIRLKDAAGLADIDSSSQEPTPMENAAGASSVANHVPGPPIAEVGPYSKKGPAGEAPVRGDHIHQVASRTTGPGASRRSAPQFGEALSVRTKNNPSYNDPVGQRAESEFNRGMWGKDISYCSPDNVVQIEASGDTTVGTSESARPSQWAYDQNSRVKLRACGNSANEAADRVFRSSEQLASNGATPARVPDAPRNTPKSLLSGEPLSPEMPASEVLSHLPAVPASNFDAVAGEGLQAAGTALTIYAVSQSVGNVLNAVDRDIKQNTFGEQTARTVAHEAAGWAGALSGAGEGAALGLLCGPPLSAICSPVGAFFGGIGGYYAGAGSVDSILFFATGH